ncbi:10338_t:CDS:1, partial [Racocetra fulgida]
MANQEASASKSAISKKKRKNFFQELQISDNLKSQAEELEVGYKFDNWEHVNQVLYTYAKIKGFVWRLQNTYYRVDKTISKKVFECHHAGKPWISNENNTTSSRVDCTCYININWPKSDPHPQVTTFESKHTNHDLNLVTTKFAPQYRSLSEPVIDRIKFYINNSSGL